MTTSPQILDGRFVLLDREHFFSIPFDIPRSDQTKATQQALSYTTTYPAGSLDTLHLTANFASEILTDARQDVNNERTITLISSVQDNFGAATGSSDIALPSGTSGFWGLGVYQVRYSRCLWSQNSILIPAAGQQGIFDHSFGFGCHR